MTATNEPQTWAPDTYGRILAAVDFSETSAHGLAHASRLAGALGIPLTVCHVLPRYVNASPLVPHYTATPSADEEQRMTAEAVERLAEWVAARTGRTPAEFALDVRWGDPATEIVAAAETSGAGLIVVASRGLGGLSRLLLGSVAESIVRHAHCPVLVMR